ncbi:MAG: cytochrome c3 family protein [Anaerolineae bacterium]
MVLQKRFQMVPFLLLLALAVPWATQAEPSDSSGRQEENGCLNCHLTLGGRYALVAQEWQGSVHARHDVACADCHGGDPQASTPEEAMSPQAGFIGVPAKSEIPQLCGDCHADPERMAPYGLPTNQLKEYSEESKHGQLLAEGDENVATCYDCHGGHRILEAQSPNSTVYPLNLPQTCAQCHSDSKLMEPYGIDTHQYESFRQSVHGIALLREHNLRAPNCATCHGIHGPSLPGLGELLDVCGAECHPQAEEAYLSGGHRSGVAGNLAAPTCITCHGRYDVQEADERMLLGDEANHCGQCHASGSPEGEIVSTIYEEISSAASSVAEARALVDAARLNERNVDEEEHRLRQAETRLMEARVLQHAVKIDLIQGKTAEARELSAQVQRDLQDPGPMASYEMQAVLIMGLIIAVSFLGFILVTVARGVIRG